MQYILALDQGTTSSRSILYNERGEKIAIAQKEFCQYFPKPGWVEHDPDEIWSSQLHTALEVINKSGIRASEIAAIALSNQRETTLVWDRITGAPVCPAIVWQDRRTNALCNALKRDGLSEYVRETTGLVIDPYFSGTKIHWILQNIAGARERAEQGDLVFGTVDTWLLYKLTSGRLHATDYSNASRTMLYDIRNLRWDQHLCDKLGVPQSMLPEVRASSGSFGATDKELLGAEIPITGIAGDQQAALFGQLCHSKGQAKNTYGTGCFMLMHTGETAVTTESGLLTTIAWGRDDRVEYALEGSVFVAGAAIQWLRDGLGVISSAQESEELACSLEDNGDVYLVPAFAGLGTPHWDASARGTIVGLTRGTGRAHIVRAALESIAFQTREVLDEMQRASNINLKELSVDGAAVSNNFLIQFQADILGVPVLRPTDTESTARGAAYLAGMAIGLWDENTIAHHTAIEHTFKPEMHHEMRDDLFERWKQAVQRAKGWTS